MIYINGIPSFRDPESFKIQFNDRVEKIKVIDDVVVQDLGHVTGDDEIAITCMFSTQNFNQILELWNSRTLVTFIDTAGISWSGMRIVMREYQIDKHFPNYVMATFELWRA